MSEKRAPNSDVESLTENTELNFNSLSLNDDHQSIRLSQGSDQSGSCLALQNQINDLGPRNVNGLHSSFQKEEKSGYNGIPGSTGNLTSEDDNSNQGRIHTSGRANDNSVVAEPALLVESSSNNINHSVAASSVIRQQNSISSGSNFSNPGLSDMRKSQGGSRQIFEAGSSNGSRQVENNLSNNLPADLYVSSSHALPMSPWSMSDVNYQENAIPRPDLYANFDTLPHPSTNIHPQRPQGLNPGREFRSPQTSMIFNSLAMGNSPLHFESNPTQSRMPQSPLTINPDLRADTSIERRQLFDQQDLANHPQHHSVAGGSYGASYNQRGHNSGFQQLPTQPLGHPSINQAGRQQTASGYPPLHPSPRNGPGSGLVNFGFAFPNPASSGFAFPNPGSSGFAPPNPASSGFAPPNSASSGFAPPNPASFGFAPPNPASSGNLSLFDAVVQSGQAQFLEPLLSPSGHGRPRTLQELSDHLERNHRTMIELRERTLSEHLHMAMRDARPNFPPHALPMLQHPRYIVHHNAFPEPGETFMPELHTGILVDVDNMSYEELLHLGEQIGSVRSGLREEKIMELLKRRDYECVTRDPSSDAETCCICREEYVHGEEIGKLNCGHEFHSGCIKHWLVIKNTCPICTAKGLGA